MNCQLEEMLTDPMANMQVRMYLMHRAIDFAASVQEVEQLVKRSLSWITRGRRLTRHDLMQFELQRLTEVERHAELIKLRLKGKEKMALCEN